MLNALNADVTFCPLKILSTRGMQGKRHVHLTSHDPPFTFNFRFQFTCSRCERHLENCIQPNLAQEVTLTGNNLIFIWQFKIRQKPK